MNDIIELNSCDNITKVETVKELLETLYKVRDIRIERLKSYIDITKKGIESQVIELNKMIDYLKEVEELK